jgi:hypothetical protein
MGASGTCIPAAPEEMRHAQMRHIGSKNAAAIAFAMRRRGDYCGAADGKYSSFGNASCDPNPE